MKFFKKAKDGGPASPVDAYFLFEIKWLCSIALLKFNKGAREQYHTHAFNAFTWFLKGKLREQRIIDVRPLESNPSCEYVVIEHTDYKRSIFPKITTRKNLHRVYAYEDSWCLTIRGPWNKNWSEVDLNKNIVTTLSHGRKIISQDGFRKI